MYKNVGTSTLGRRDECNSWADVKRKEKRLTRPSLSLWRTSIHFAAWLQIFRQFQSSYGIVFAPETRPSTTTLLILFSAAVDWRCTYTSVLGGFWLVTVSNGISRPLLLLLYQKLQQTRYFFSLLIDPSFTRGWARHLVCVTNCVRADSRFVIDVSPRLRTHNFSSSSKPPTLFPQLVCCWSDRKRPTAVFNRKKKQFFPLSLFSSVSQHECQLA